MSKKNADTTAKLDDAEKDKIAAALEKWIATQTRIFKQKFQQASSSQIHAKVVNFFNVHCHVGSNIVTAIKNNGHKASFEGQPVSDLRFRQVLQRINPPNKAIVDEPPPPPLSDEQKNAIAQNTKAWIQDPKAISLFKNPQARRAKLKREFIGGSEQLAALLEHGANAKLGSKKSSDKYFISINNCLKRAAPSYAVNLSSDQSVNPTDGMAEPPEDKQQPLLGSMKDTIAEMLQQRLDTLANYENPKATLANWLSLGSVDELDDLLKGSKSNLQDSVFQQAHDFLNHQPDKEIVQRRKNAAMAALRKAPIKPYSPEEKKPPRR